MTVKVKSKVFQVRVDPELYAAYQAVADSHELTVSETIRGFMRSRVKMALEARSGVLERPAVPDSHLANKMPSTTLRVRPSDKKERRLERKQGR